MTYERNDYMRRQEAEHDLLRMRTPPPWFNPLMSRFRAVRPSARRYVDSEAVARMIEAAEIAPIIKQRLIDGIIDLESGETK